MIKNPPANARDSGLIPGLGKSPGERNGHLLQYSCLENSMDRGAWWATVHGVAKNWTLLSKAFDCVDHNKLWEILKEMRIPDHLTCLLRNLYAGQEATELDMEQLIGNRKRNTLRLYTVTHYLTYMQSKYIMRNAGLDEAQAGSKLPGEISITSATQMTPPLWQKVKRN